MQSATHLGGIRVLDLSIWRPGPYATSLLVALGADVLKVEPPGGDPMRHYAGLFDVINVGKRSIELDLKDDDDRSRALELAAAADVIVEGFRPGVMARLGLDYEATRRANPAVVYCSISGYGQSDPRAALPGHDVNYQAWAGALSPEGGSAHMPPLPIADLASGLCGAFGICAALLGHDATGEGTYLDVSMTDVMSTWTGPSGGSENPREDGPSQAVPGYGLFTTAEGGQVALGVVNEQHFWSRLCAALGLDDLAGLDFAERSARGDELQRAVRAAITTQGRDELVTALLAAGVPASPVLDRTEMLAGPSLPGFPIRLPTPVVSGPVPRLDQHRGERVLMTLIAELLAANRGYAAARAHIDDPRPSRHLAVVTCMDARIDVFAVLGLHLGDAHVIRNAGGRVTEDVLRSLALSTGVLGVDTVVVMQHTGCGLAGVTDDELRALTGADLGFLPIDDHTRALREDMELLTRTPYLSALRLVAGLVYDVESGELEDVVSWERPA